METPLRRSDRRRTAGIDEMRRRRSIGFVVVFGAVVAAAVLGFARQRLETRALRRELETAQEGVRDLTRLQAENKRLGEQQISPAALESLRADHAALPRLRAELETLKKTGSPDSR